MEQSVYIEAETKRITMVKIEHQGKTLSETYVDVSAALMVSTRWVQRSHLQNMTVLYVKLYCIVI